MKQLSYDQCVALRDAGYRGHEYDRYYWDSPLGRCLDTLQNARGSSTRLACPGSDTLLEWMQARWPDEFNFLQWDTESDPWSWWCCGRTEDEEYQVFVDNGDMQYLPPKCDGRGDTPVEALCNLALALAAQEGK